MKNMMSGARCFLVLYATLGPKHDDRVECTPTYVVHQYSDLRKQMGTRVYVEFIIFLH